MQNAKTRKLMCFAGETTKGKKRSVTVKRANAVKFVAAHKDARIEKLAPARFGIEKHLNLKRTVNEQ